MPQRQLELFPGSFSGFRPGAAGRDSGRAAVVDRRGLPPDGDGGCRSVPSLQPAGLGGGQRLRQVVSRAGRRAALELAFAPGGAHRVGRRVLSARARRATAGRRTADCRRVIPGGQQHPAAAGRNPQSVGQHPSRRGADRRTGKSAMYWRRRGFRRVSGRFCRRWTRCWATRPRCW